MRLYCLLWPIQCSRASGGLKHPLHWLQGKWGKVPTLGRALIALCCHLLLYFCLEREKYSQRRVRIGSVAIPRVPSWPRDRNTWAQTRRETSQVTVQKGIASGKGCDSVASVEELFYSLSFWWSSVGKEASLPTMTLIMESGKIKR